MRFPQLTGAAWDYQQFTFVRWLLLLVNLGVIITIWGWIPDLLDAIVPFMR